MKQPRFLFILLLALLSHSQLIAAGTDTLIFGVEVADWPAADEAEARAKRLTDLAWDYKDIDIAVTDSLASWALHISKAHQLTKRQAVAHKLLAGLAVVNDQHARADSLYTIAFSQFQSLEDSVGQIAVLNSLVAFAVLRGDCQEATQYGTQGMTLALAREDHFRYLVLGINYVDALANCGQEHKALSLLDSLERVAIEIEQVAFFPHIHNLRGYSLYRLKQFRSALEELEIGLKEAESQQDGFAYSDILNQIGLVYLESNQPALALEYFEESACVDEQLVGRTKEVVTLLGIGATLQRLGLHEDAKGYLEEGIAHCEETGKSQIVLEAYRAIGLTYGALGDYEKGFHYLQKFEAKYDSLVGVEVQQTVAEMNAEFERERMAHTLAQTQQEMAAQRSRLINILLMLSGGFIIILGTYLVVFAIMRRKKAEAEKRQIELEYTALRAQMNPHFIFNALNSIQGYFAEQDFARGNEYLGAFGQLMRDVLDSSSQRFISLQEELHTLDLYLQLEQVRLTDKLSYTFHISEGIDTDMATLPPLILQPFVENAIWHGIVPKDGPGHIRIHLSGDEDYLIATIEDDGIGIEASANLKRQHRRKHVSRGIQITEERLGPMGSLTISERVDGTGAMRGTRVQLIIPQIDD